MNNTKMSSFHMSTWNIEGKGSSEDIDRILSSSYFQINEADEKNPPLFAGHIVCVQQANLPSGGESENYKWLCSGEFGSAVLISKDSPFKPGYFEQVCEQICVAEVIINEETVLKVISCYIPPSTDYVTGDLWAKLIKVMKTIPSNVTYLLGGDFNAEIGSEDVCLFGIDKGMIGRNLCHKTSNENGILLRKLTLNSHAKIINTFGLPNATFRAAFHTYKNGDEISQRSYILVPCDRLPLKSFHLMCQLIWQPDYKHAILTRYLKPSFYEKLSKVIPPEIMVSSWNVHGVSTLAVDKVLNELDLPVVCVQDLFLTSDNDVRTKNFTWFTSKKLWGKNVGILIKTNPDITMADFEVVSEYICVGNVNLRDCMIKVICCFLPLHTDSALFHEVAAKLNDVVKSVPEDIKFMVAGDFNTNVRIINRDGSLVFDEGDENSTFLQKFMQEFHLEATHMHKNSVTVQSENSRRNSSHVLSSPSCLIKYFHKRFVRWVPFFESAIVTLSLAENELGPNYSHGREKSLEMLVELVDGQMYVTKKVFKLTRIYTLEVDDQGYCLIPEFIKHKAEQKSDLPEEIVTKYKNTPPPIEELLRILGDEFTIYYGFLQESTLPKGNMSVLAASFEFLMRGDLLVEIVDILDAKTETPTGKVVKFRWNGIIVHLLEIGALKSFTRAIIKGQSDFLLTLGQHCFTVKAKRSFYNNGLPPMCRDKDKLKEVLREVKRSEFPPTATVEDVQKFIDDFFKEETYLELVFGSCFPKDEFLEPIKRYAKSKNLGVRWFKSTSSLQYWDSLAVFMEISPYKIHKRLMEVPDHQDLKFHLLPPCGVENNYFDWSIYWAEKIIPDVNHWIVKILPEKLYHPKDKKMDTDDSICEVAKYKDEDNKSDKNSKQDDVTHLEEVVNQKLQRPKRKILFVHEEVKQVGELTYRINKCSNMYSGSLTIPRVKGNKDWMSLARQETDLPIEIVEKYKESCIPEEELSSVLGDEFTLYYGFVRESCVVKGSMEILAESFESTNRGGLMAENIDVYKGNLHYERIIKFKWNGIVVHEEKGSAQVSFKKTMEVGRLALINKLGRHFYTVKAKKSFYNKCLPPICTDENKLNEVIRVVKRSDFPLTATSADVMKIIDDCLLENPHLEIVFGPDFTQKGFMDPVKKYVAVKNLGIRSYKSSSDIKQHDNLVVFIKRAPLEIRERLKKLPDQQDLKFYLIPPCGGDKTYPEWTNEWVNTHVPDEAAFFQNKNTVTPKPAASAEMPQKMQSQETKEKHKLDGYESPDAKRAKSEVYESPRWEEVAPLIILWPVNIRSEYENNRKKVLEANFPTEVITESYQRIVVFVTLPLRNQRSKRFCLGIASRSAEAIDEAFTMIVKNSSVIKYTPQYLPPGGRVPEFIRYSIPCQENPRTYILLSHHETGPLTHANVIEIFHNLKASCNEDVFFDKNGYTHQEKKMLIDLAPQYNLKVRHFGDDTNLINRYVCVYKTKPKDVILEEVMRMRGFHPKYIRSHPGTDLMGGFTSHMVFDYHVGGSNM